MHNILINPELSKNKMLEFVSKCPKNCPKCPKKGPKCLKIAQYAKKTARSDICPEFWDKIGTLLKNPKFQDNVLNLGHKGSTVVPSMS